MSPREYQHPKSDEITLAKVLAALSDPTRLEMIRRLADGQEHDSRGLADDLPRSTLTYHTRMLREAGVTWTRGEGRACLIQLRRDDLDQLFPGVLAAVISNAGSEVGKE
ncbi:helix-turn-helix domain-containing protein [Corynebacterium sp. p3-SID1145]|uniref:ArsR/SmtB family transcription factor n=1 Tax=unclassified Corynebacterium TaxID=2624378 RepID=UPI0021A9F5B2|nr:MULTISPECIES: helix-turn-helix domain-containing protein [unclassified Corynebacterium]MCT1451888.1 helix-turn-helix domain-containing protein [Corynebacterium sp. p3-SID1145]MCT1461137.1 helix-turn-helix domain-containing protein [Corynebacterium sp. p3-SID1140]